MALLLLLEEIEPLTSPQVEQHGTAAAETGHNLSLFHIHFFF